MKFYDAAIFGLLGLILLAGLATAHPHGDDDDIPDSPESDSNSVSHSHSDSDSNHDSQDSDSHSHNDHNSHDSHIDGDSQDSHSHSHSSEESTAERVFECDFEDNMDFTGNNFCDFIQPDDQDNRDDFDWIRNKGATLSVDTGPDNGNEGSDYYAYIEVSGMDEVSTAKLEIDLSYEDYNCFCLSFAYHMYGKHIGTMRVVSQDDNGKNEEEWKVVGETGDQWLEVSISVDYNAESIFIEAGNKLVGQPFGDIAIDDVVVTNKCCGDTTPATVKPSDAPTSTPRPDGFHCLDIDRCLDCICKKETDLGNDRDGKRCDITRNYFQICRAEGLSSLRNPSYEQCLRSEECRHECIYNFVSTEMKRCVGTEDIFDLSCFDVARVHKGGWPNCRRKFSFNFGLRVMSPCYAN